MKRPLRIVLTGWASFTGAWFAYALRARGHEVVGLSRRPAVALDPLERERVERLAPLETRCEGAPIGASATLARLRALGPFDVFCAHGAAGNRPSLEPSEALAANLDGADAALEASGARALAVTGSVYEAGEGLGDAPLRAFDDYGLGKSWSWAAWREIAERRGLALGKFTIAQPFGPWAKPGLAPSLIEAWLFGRAAVVRAPQLVRDHLPVRPLAQAHARYVEALAAERAPAKLTPSALPESIWRFAERLSAAMEPRLGRPCPVRAAPAAQAAPLRRVGVDPLDQWAEWSSEDEWDALARWSAMRRFAGGPLARSA